ncbi:berberine bridge enzyme-like 26 [Carica papaya]|uniref:berberine bridge enzyme-like 26 n=1 Tax=Carica papaya TaxID=3649 RepID=UPI000B8CFCB7|nr:berberine bridge enzyme-like 26 [Carica papaya]
MVSLLFLILISLHFSTPSLAYYNGFMQCFDSHLKSSSNIIFTRNDPQYSSVLKSSIRNLRFLNSTLKPELIITPTHESHIQAAILCAKKQSLQVRIRSGGHDYEGSSYLSHLPFMIIDLVNLRSINVDVENECAWVESGATTGELYYKIAEKSKSYGFPAGTCHTIGIGGHISGGGLSVISRKYGLAADNVIDAKIIDASGRILERKSMGEDLFWAIRGGGGSSFGVILSWKIKLSPVPKIVTVFKIEKTLKQGAIRLLQKWQNIAYKLPKEIYLHATMENIDTTSNPHGEPSIIISFEALFLGQTQELLLVVQEAFPELGLSKEACKEMNWVQSVLYFAGFSPNSHFDLLLNRSGRTSFKSKTDYVKNPISETGLEGLYKFVLAEKKFRVHFEPYGGKISEISDSETPFPHRSGIMYGLQYSDFWEDEQESEKHIKSMRSLYNYMGNYVSKNPRAAYLNGRDLDLGMNRIDGNTSFEEASTWGFKYFKNNFKRLVHVKTAVDPSNFFKDEQSIPILE